MKTEGFQALWKGFVPCLLAVPGTGIYFLSYEKLKKMMQLKKSNDEPRHWTETVKYMLAGGLSG